MENGPEPQAIRRDGLDLVGQEREAERQIWCERPRRPFAPVTNADVQFFVNEIIDRRAALSVGE